jgi:hypothetical protein
MARKLFDALTPTRFPAWPDLLMQSSPSNSTVKLESAWAYWAKAAFSIARRASAISARGTRSARAPQLPHCGSENRRASDVLERCPGVK